MAINLNFVDTQPFCQASSKRHNATRALLPNYTPKNTGDYRGLPQPESTPGFDGWLKFEPVPESDSIDGSERYRIIYWQLKPEKAQQPQHWGYVSAGGQWFEYEIRELKRQFEAARDKHKFLRKLDEVLDAIATSVVATSGAVEVAA